MKVYQFLTKEKWIKYAFARDKDDKTVDQFSKYAKKFCVIGAICKVYRKNKLIREKMEMIKSKVGMNVSDWNDEGEYEGVRKVLKELDI